jgi:hypothetical protein
MSDSGWSHVIEVRPATADQVILAFLHAEIDSRTDRGSIFAHGLAKTRAIGPEKAATAGGPIPRESGGCYSFSVCRCLKPAESLRRRWRRRNRRRLRMPAATAAKNAASTRGDFSGHPGLTKKD